MKEGLIIIGAPFSGKNTISNQLVEKEKISHIDAGLLVRERAKTDESVREITAAGLQLPPEVSCRFVMDEIDNLSTNVILINGFPRQKVNAERISSVFDPWAVVVLDVDVDEIYRRHDNALERKDRVDHGREILQHRLDAFFSRDTYDVYNYYAKLGLLHFVDANNNIPTVYKNVYDIYSANKKDMSKFEPNIEQFNFKRDKYRTERGGQATMIEIDCSCGHPVMIYQKDGYKKQHLYRTYLNRIFYPENLEALQRTASSEKEMPELCCPGCRQKIGTPMRHKDGRLAYGLLMGNFVRKNLPNQDIFK